jgi:copper homeostasis protein
MNIGLEICATNLRSVQIAADAGCDRVELCSCLDAGGLTPSLGLISRAARESIQVYVLIRPREGGFVFDQNDLRIMEHDIHACEQAGASGVVIGALSVDGALDISQMDVLKRAAGRMDVTCHRAFDFTRNPSSALEQLIDLGIRRVLTSGQAQDARAGIPQISALVTQARNRISIMPGAGVNARNIVEIITQTGVHEIHLSGKKRMEVAGALSKISGLDTGHWECDPLVLQAVIKALQDFQAHAKDHTTNIPTV